MDSKSVSAEPAQLRAVSYARYSSDGQRASSIVDQERNCHRRADAEGWTITARYADAAISGSDNRRPQYLAMQQAAARREFDLLLVDDLSRLTRDSVATGDSRQTPRIPRYSHYRGRRWLRQPKQVAKDTARI